MVHLLISPGIQFVKIENFEENFIIRSNNFVTVLHYRFCHITFKFDIKFGIKLDDKGISDLGSGTLEPIPILGAGGHN